MVAKNKPNEFTITRIYDAPIKTVWEAWTDVKQVAKWWGPRGFTITTHGKDLKPGGFWKYTMHGPDGVDYENVTIYHEVEKYSRLVYDHGGSEDRPPLFRVTVEFSEVKGKTKMEMTMALATAEALEETKKFIKKANGYSTWDRLAEYLEKEKTGKEKFVINRSFNAPQELIFKMWTDPEHATKWFGPTGSTMEYIRANIKTGGNAFFCMHAGNGIKMYGLVKYLEVVQPTRLVYTQQFADEKENVSRHPMAPVWPETMHTIVTFTKEAPDKTLVTVEWEPTGSVSKAELEAFIKERTGMSLGWGGSFDRLDEYLASLQ